MGEIYNQDWNKFVKEDNLIPSVEEVQFDNEDFISSFVVNYSLDSTAQSSLNIY